MEHSPFWEGNRSLASQEITRILWNPKSHYRIHTRPPPVPKSDQTSPCSPFHILKIHFNITLLSMSKSSKWSPSFPPPPHQNSISNPFVSYMCHTSCSAVLHCLRRAKGSVQVRGIVKCFVTLISFYGEELLEPRLTPNPKYHLLSALRDCLFSIFAGDLRIWRPFLHLLPEDAPCRDYRACTYN
jgi:hypothetical protein